MCGIELQIVWPKTKITIPENIQTFLAEKLYKNSQITALCFMPTVDYYFSE